MTAAPKKTKATPRRSPLEESPLADLVEDVTDREARVAGHSTTPADDVETAAERERKIELTMKEKGVPRKVAVVMVDKGYSKGSAFRIINDEFKRETAKRERAAGIGA